MNPTIKSQKVYQGLIFDVHQDRVGLPGGMETTLEIIRHPGAAAVVPWHEDGTVTLIRQYRYAAGGFIHEVPAGKLDAGESPETCAQRELTEETGLKAARLKPLGWILTTPGFTDEKIWLFVATGLEGGRQALEQDEILTTLRLPFAEALEMIAQGKIPDSKTCCALFRLRQEQEQESSRAS